MTAHSPETGQREKLVEGTKADARRLEAQLRLELRAKPVAASRAVPRFSTFCVEAYGPHARATLADRTWRRTRIYQVDALSSFFGETRLDAFSSQLVERFAAHGTSQGWEPGYVNTLLRTLGAVLAWARTQGQPVPPLTIGRLKPGKRRVRAWSLDEVRALYKAARAHCAWMVPLLHFLFDTGVRKGELVAAEWSWVDFEAKLLRIPVTRWWRPKNKRPREVPLSDALLERLRRTPRVGSHIFTAQQHGGPYAYFPDAAWRELRKAAKVTGVIHMTRHTYASHFLAGLPDLPLLATVLGHSTTYVTELYAHMLPEHLARARNVVQLAPPSLAPALAVVRGSRKTSAK